jgi:hypothetical protein
MTEKSRDAVFARADYSADPLWHLLLGLSGSTVDM